MISEIWITRLAFSVLCGEESSWFWRSQRDAVSAAETNVKPKRSGNNIAARTNKAPNGGAKGTARPVSYEALVRTIERERIALANRSPSLAQARQMLHAPIVTQLFPRWLGTSWEFNGTAKQPYGAEGIAGGYFIATILQHAGLRLSSRTKFGQAGALATQTALTPDPSDLHRILSVPADEVAARIAAMGDGLYLRGWAG